MQKLCVTTVHVVAVEVQGCTLTNWGGGGAYQGTQKFMNELELLVSFSYFKSTLLLTTCTLYSQ